MSDVKSMTSLFSLISSRSKQFHREDRCHEINWKPIGLDLLTIKTAELTIRVTSLLLYDILNI